MVGNVDNFQLTNTHDYIIVMLNNIQFIYKQFNNVSIGLINVKLFILFKCVLN